MLSMSPIETLYKKKSYTQRKMFSCHSNCMNCRNWRRSLCFLMCGHHRRRSSTISRTTLKRLTKACANRGRVSLVRTCKLWSMDLRMWIDQRILRFKWTHFQQSRIYRDLHCQWKRHINCLRIIGEDGTLQSVHDIERSKQQLATFSHSSRNMSIEIFYLNVRFWSDLQMLQFSDVTSK